MTGEISAIGSVFVSTRFRVWLTSSTENATSDQFSTKPVRAAADLHEELRLATGITYTVLRKEPAGPIDLQRLVHVSRLKHVRDRALRHAFFNAADRVAVVHPRILDPSKRDYIHLYRGDSKTLSESLDRIQRTASTILNAVSGG